MVRLSKSDDISGIISLWKEAFGDSDEDIRFFLDANYKPENTLVNECDGKITSVLFLLDGYMHIKNNDYPSYYLYAACTLKEYRGRGQMAELLEFAKELSRYRNKYFISLKPAEESLFEYYSRFGYRTAFYKKSAVINLSDILSDSVTKSEADGFILSDIRNNHFANSDYFKWDETSVEYAVKQNEHYGGFIFKNCKGYILYDVNSEILTVKENTFPPGLFIDIIKTIALNHNSDNVKADFSVNFNCSALKFKIYKSGMLLPLNEDAENLFGILKNAYLGLTLD